jgi:hypothetical protein
MKPEDIPHGKRRAYRHCRIANGGQACLPCRKAEAAYMASWRRHRPELQWEQMVKQNARKRALVRLAQAHPQEFSDLLAEELRQDEVA